MDSIKHVIDEMVSACWEAAENGGLLAGMIAERDIPATTDCEWEYSDIADMLEVRGASTDDETIERVRAGYSRALRALLDASSDEC